MTDDRLRRAAQAVVGAEAISRDESIPYEVERAIGDLRDVLQREARMTDDRLREAARAVVDDAGDLEVGEYALIPVSPPVLRALRAALAADPRPASERIGAPNRLEAPHD